MGVFITFYPKKTNFFTLKPNPNEKVISFSFNVVIAYIYKYIYFNTRGAKLGGNYIIMRIINN